MTRRAENDDKSGKSGHSGRRREERLKAALRENLRRRKAQERARSASPAAGERPATDPSGRESH